MRVSSKCQNDRPIGLAARMEQRSKQNHPPPCSALAA
jgi:hypothetical protein